MSRSLTIKIDLLQYPMDAATFISIILGLIVLTIVIVLIATLTRVRKKTRVLNQIDILTDELARQRKENLSRLNEIKRMSSMDNLLFASLIRLTSRLNPSEIAKEVTGLLTNYLDPEEVAVFLADDRGMRLRVIDHRGLKDFAVPKLIYETTDDARRGKVGLCFVENHPLTKRDVVLGVTEPYPVFTPDICFPLSYQGTKFGVIAIRRALDLEERERNLLGVIANIAGITLNNTRTAHADPLTQLYNIRYFQERLEEELNNARTRHKNLAIIIIDLDNFKNYNDTYGHQAGDLLLMRLAQIFIKHFDTEETLARYGGDEFIILCPGIKKTDAARIVGHMLQELKKYDFASGKKKAAVTFSAGVSSYPDDAITATELIRLADHALYAAKRSGRNAVKAYDPKIGKL